MIRDLNLPLIAKTGLKTRNASIKRTLSKIYCIFESKTIFSLIRFFSGIICHTYLLRSFCVNKSYSKHGRGKSKSFNLKNSQSSINKFNKYKLQIVYLSVAYKFHMKDMAFILFFNFIKNCISCGNFFLLKKYFCICILG